MGLNLNKIVLYLGILCIIHAGISAAQHRSYIRITEQEFDFLPADIFLQTLLGLFLASFGIFKVAGEFKNIQFNADLKSKTFENFGSSLSFCSFEHRGKTLAEKFY